MHLSKKEKFSILFDKHYQRLFNYSFKVIGNKDVAEDLVQETFMKLWDKIDNINSSEQAIESYIITTLKNKIIDFHRKAQTRKKNIDLYKINKEITQEIETTWELENQINLVYSKLQEKTAEIFRLSRNEGLSYKEIAEQKNISIKTVELHISKALSIFREELKKIQ
ncbi:RNA polymerase sigma-70 factor [Aquimarina sp. 2201CG5-10]|uniref:RNA polymerase sigma factor n=1 Tax=Aquimarina callyspongiae TaxID=3098150 RepID=UPI002AB54485|nr:RNA polymerase sigma-70 factor [Aquimarina sp. 2201CG5-10]MDY8134030.1 RNA polymerase sigma-70 factor [Aquimarina sp. 2201CG5-10]